MLQSFIVYGIFAASLAWLGSISAKRERLYLAKEKTPSFWVWDIIFALLIFALISGIRWQVGVDHLSYLESYEKIMRGGQFRARGVEPGFDFITRLFASFNIHFTLYFAFWAFLQIFLIYYALRNERYLLPFIALLIIWGPEYLNMMNGIRQMLALSIFVYSIQFIYERKFVHYIVTIFIATLFHKSAFLLFIIYFIPQKDYFKNRYVNIVILIVAVIIGLYPVWVDNIKNIGNLIALIGYETYTERITSVQDAPEVMNFGPRRVVTLLLYLVNIWYASTLKRHFKETKYLIYFNLTFVGAVLYNLLANTSFVFLRPLVFFTFFLVVSTAYLLHYLKPQNKFKVPISFLLVFILSISYTIISIIAESGKGDLDFTNYKFFWDYLTY